MKNPYQVMRAHQYLYYCLGMPVISDYEYDLFCQQNKLEGKGSSDLESSYTQEEKQLAEYLLNPQFLQTR